VHPERRKGWTPRRTATFAAAQVLRRQLMEALSDAAALVIVPRGWCQGQGRLWADNNGEGLCPNGAPVRWERRA
jgi:hypothetical protein